jgi:alcohol dehydrogenase class IV
VIAVGGGSVLDMAKLVSGLAFSEDPLAVIQGRAPIGQLAAPLIAVPTTSGSGSEATHFAVVYANGTKFSMADERLLPAWAVVDPALTDSLSPRNTAISGIDAFCQAVESSWSIHSSSASRAWAARAIALAVEHLPAAVNAPTPLTRRMMSKASHLAGRAINVTKTTAAHALSYPLTMRHGVPHGQAVCLTLGGLLVFNEQVTAEDVTDARGVGHVRRAIEDVSHLLGGENARAAAGRIDALIRSIGLSTSLEALNVPCKAAVDDAVAGVNVDRLGNNPRRLRERDLRDLLESVCHARP